MDNLAVNTTAGRADRTDIAWRSIGSAIESAEALGGLNVQSLGPIGLTCNDLPMLNDVWPPVGVRVRTPLVELRYPTDDELADLGNLAAQGIHDPAVQPFSAAWTDVPAAELPRAVVTYHWQQRAAVAPTRWSLNLVAVHEGTVVGTQGIGATDFAVVREVGSGSWLGRRYHGRGLGTHVRAAMLHLAFVGLGARYATSGAFLDN